MVRTGEWISEGWELVKPHLGIHVGIALVVALLSAITMGIVLGPLVCGWYLILLRQQRDGSYVPQFADLWKGFEVFGHALLAYIVIVVTAAIAGSLVGTMAAAVAAVPLVGQGLAPLVGTAVAVCVTVFFLWVFPLVIDRRIDFWSAIRTSAETSAPLFGQLIGFAFLLVLLKTLGLALCGVGALLTVPVVMGATAVAYRDILETEAVSDEPSASEHGGAGSQQFNDES